MTTPRLSRRMEDNALAALDCLEAYEDRNLSNLNTIISTTSQTDLMEGLLILAGAFRKTAAVSYGVTDREISDLAREMYLGTAA